MFSSTGSFEFFYFAKKLVVVVVVLNVCFLFFLLRTECEIIFSMKIGCTFDEILLGVLERRIDK